MKKRIHLKELFRIPNQVPPYPGELSSEVGNPATALALREARRINDKCSDRIWKYYYDPKKEILLTEQEEEMRRRIVNAWDLLTGKILNDRKAALAQVQWCKDNYLDISERTAYDDIRRAKQLFGDPRVSTAMFDKARISSILLDLIEQAKANGDLYNAHRLISRYNAVNGLETTINKVLPRPPIIIQFNAEEEVLRKQAAELMKGVKGTIDISHTEEEDDQGS